MPSPWTVHPDTPWTYQQERNLLSSTLVSHRLCQNTQHEMFFLGHRVLRDGCMKGAFPNPSTAKDADALRSLRQKTSVSA